jgi:hypothetical protein
MRKIKSMKDVERVRRRNNLILGVVMIGLLLLSTLGFSLMSGDGDDGALKVSENGVDFFRQNGLWVMEVDGEDFSFQNLPSEVSNISVNVSATLGQYSGEPLYFINPSGGVNEILINIGDYILRYQEACLRQDLVGSGQLAVSSGLDDCEGDLPVRGCDDNLIIFGSGDESKVYGDGGCVFIVGDSVRGADAFLYKMLQIV